MKHWSSAIRTRSVVILLLASALALAAADRSIRLRTGTIDPQSLGARTAQVNPAGLVLLQIRSDAPVDWRVQVEALGVKLLQAVPRDAWIADLNSAAPMQLRALPFVSWLGPYTAQQKLHAALKNPGTESVRVGVLLSREAVPAEIATARSQFTRLEQESRLRLGTILRGSFPAARLEMLAQSKAVLWIEPAADMKLNDEVASKIVAGDGGPNQLLAQSLGYDGSGVKVAVADSGLNNGDEFTMHPDLLGRTPDFFFYGALTDAADEHSHGTHCAGIIAGNGATGETDATGALYGLGVAPGAAIIAQRIFDALGGYQAPPSFERLTRDAKRAGADIGSNSWGDDTQGRYDLSAMEFDELVRDCDSLTLGDQAYILEFSAGNAGPGQQTIGSPAVAKNVIATGASQNDSPDQLIYADGPEAMADFSSRGPCEDGRIKPDVCAPGTWIASLQSQSATDQYAWAPISANYMFQGGTSQAGPHVSGAAAVFVQFYRETVTNTTPSPALVKAALINSAVDLDNASGTTATPNNDEGWGRVDLAALVDTDLVYDYLDQTVLLTNSQVFERRVLIASSDLPLKITLAYSDVPGFPGAIPSLVNDLDLEVVAPDGHTYRGNQFDQGESVADAAGHDAVNNVEGVQLAAPSPGEWIIRVRARHVVEDARIETVKVDQDFALVTSGDIAAPGQSIVYTDRQAYRAPDTIRLTVIDKDRAGQPSVTVKVSSSLETTPETKTLLAANSTGTFTNSISIVTAPVAADGKLAVAHNNQITVEYFDASAGQSEFATVRADLVAPLLTAVGSTNEFGLTIVSWTTDEPATSIVRFNTNSSLTRAVTNLALVTDHTVVLSGLISNKTYFYHVVATDEAGNTATNNNGGALFNFVAPTVAPVLLVNAAYDDLFGLNPPLSGYTSALSQLGIGYEVWNKQTRPSIGLTNLLPYRAVIWRLSEFPSDPNNLGWTINEQNALADYLRRGGSLLASSMEILTRLEEGGFANAKLGMLHVQSFITDNDPDDVGAVIGAGNDPISAGMNVALDYSVYHDPDPLGFKNLLDVPDDVSDTITPDPFSQPIFYDDLGEVIGLKYPRTGLDSTGRVVFLSFPLDAVPASAGSVNNRAGLLRGILQFLVPGFDGRATLALDRGEYSTPDLITVEIDDADLAGSGSVNITYASTTQSAPTTLALLETPRRGTFRGTIELVPATNAPAPGTLRVANGNLITVKYFDASAAITNTATASVDTVPPDISGVAADPGYQEATITWTTTENADSLVQFGETPLLFQSKFDPALDTSHEVLISGLLPDTVYYYQVVSRDPAGNATTASNVTNYYSFRTLKPITPPWFDNLNTGATNWTSYDADGSQTSWALGTPRNSLATNAYSPPACFATSLSSNVIDYAETFLISPAVYLTGGNQATLRFYHSYDFTDKTGNDILEMGTLYAVDNSSGAATPLDQFTDAAYSWELAEYDLSPFAGKVIYLVWAYQIVSFDAAERPGWLLDDVSVTVSNLLGGTIRITNNLWQANFALSGPAGRDGKGKSLVITNAPPGQYIIEYGDLAYYQKPAAQTNTLTASGTLVFTGNYTFPDANANGIPDGWELATFGSIATNRTASTDTDADGLSDAAEFVAGTDPLNPPPPFKLTARKLTGGGIQLAWPSLTNFQYRIHGSLSLPAWAPYTGWLPATPATNFFNLPAPTNNAPRFFRIEARAADSPNAPRFLLNAQRLINGQVRLDWPSAPGHGYRVLGSANFSGWTPVTDWLRASGYGTGLSLAPTNGNFRFYRVEAAP